MEHSLCDSVIVLKGRLSVINFVDLPNHDEFTEQQLWCTDPWTCSSSLISQFLPLLWQSILQTKTVRLIFSKCKQFLSYFILKTLQWVSITFTINPNSYSSFRSSSYSRPCLSAQSPFLLPFHSAPATCTQNSSGSWSFHFFVQTQRLGTYYTLTNNIHARVILQV